MEVFGPIFKWLRRLFAKEKAKELITKEQLQERATWAINLILILHPYPPIDLYVALDRENEAMALFVEDCPYLLQKRDLIIARKLIKNNKVLFLQERFI